MLKCQVIGNLGGDAKVNRGDYKSFVSFNVAHAEKYVDKSGVTVEEVKWVNCVVNWDCSKILPYLRKGAKVYCCGALRTRLFNGRDGQMHAGLDCIVTDIELCGGSRPETSIPQSEDLEGKDHHGKKNKNVEQKKVFQDGEDPFEYQANAE